MSCASVNIGQERKEQKEICKTFPKESPNEGKVSLEIGRGNMCPTLLTLVCPFQLKGKPLLLDFILFLLSHILCSFDTLSKTTRNNIFLILFNERIPF